MKKILIIMIGFLILFSGCSGLNKSEFLDIVKVDNSNCISNATNLIPDELIYAQVLRTATKARLSELNGIYYEIDSNGQNKINISQNKFKDGTLLFDGMYGDWGDFHKGEQVGENINNHYSNDDYSLYYKNNYISKNGDIIGSLSFEVKNLELNSFNKYIGSYSLRKDGYGSKFSFKTYNIVNFSIANCKLT